MKEDHHFEIKGFLFFVKFIVLVLLLAVSTNLGSEIISHNVYAQDNNTSIIETKLVAISEKRQKTFTPKNNTITLGFVGDVMLDRGIERVIMKNGNGDFSFPFRLIENKLKKYDILFGNLEGPISNKGEDLGSIYSFRMDPKTAGALNKVGFDILSVANNHAGDWGKVAAADTYLRLSMSGIAYSGGGFTKEEAYTPNIMHSGDLKIAYISFSEFGKGYLEAVGDEPGIAIISETKLKESINTAKAEADIVIASFHYGDEYKPEPNSYQEKISKMAIDYGADLVIGHHPHIPEPVVKYKDGYIAYSLGNFIFDQNLKEDGSDVGMIFEAIIEDGKIKEVNEVEIRFNDAFQPFIVE